jgi:Transposase DDE domain
MQTQKERQLKQETKQQRRRARKTRRNLSDAVRLFRFISNQVNVLLPNLRFEHQLTLAMLITGLLQSRNGQLSQMVRKVQYNHHQQSLLMRFRRFVGNTNVDAAQLYQPLVSKILAALGTDDPLVLMVDTTQIGGKCLCLMVSLYYKNRALPLDWLVVKGKKGHLSQELQLSLFKRVKALLPAQASVVLVGDAEFDGSEVITWLQTDTSWQYVFRTQENIQVGYQGQQHSLKEWLLELEIQPLMETFLMDVTFTTNHQVPQQNIMVVWHKTKQRHEFLVTNCATFAQAQGYYRLRYTTETLFADLKGRGFHLTQTRLWQPERLNRLLLVACWAYYLMVFLGVEAIFSNLFRELVRTDAFVHSLFQLGLILLDHLLKEGLTFPKTIDLPPPKTVTHCVISP